MKTLPSVAQAQFAYAKDNGGIMALVIPATIEGLPVTGIADRASIEPQSGSFSYLTRVTIPASVTIAGQAAFERCLALKRVYSHGNAPKPNLDVFAAGTVYYLDGTTGWTASFGGRSTRKWSLVILTGDGNLGVRDGKFGFTVSGCFPTSSGIPLVIEACDGLAHPLWTPVSTNILDASGMAPFTDPAATASARNELRVRVGSDFDESTDAGSSLNGKASLG